MWRNFCEHWLARCFEMHSSYSWSLSILQRAFDGNLLMLLPILTVSVCRLCPSELFPFGYNGLALLTRAGFPCRTTFVNKAGWDIVANYDVPLPNFGKIGLLVVVVTSVHIARHIHREGAHYTKEYTHMYMHTHIHSHAHRQKKQTEQVSHQFIQRKNN